MNLKRVADFGLHVVLPYCENDGSKLVCLGYIGKPWPILEKPGLDLIARAY